MSPAQSKIPKILERYETELLTDWIRELRKSAGARLNKIPDAEIRGQAARFLGLLRDAAQTGSFDDIQTPEWAPLREMLAELSRSRARQGFTPSETAAFVFSFKNSLVSRLRQELAGDLDALFEEVWATSLLLDKLGLFTTEIHQQAREELILKQRVDLLELSTPVVKLWDGILALPIIGTLDSARTQVLTESLLQKLVETGSEIAIIDITGVPTVDTLVAQHLLKTVAAARLMGADCIISGISVRIAQTIVHLAIDLSGVITRATLADAFRAALQRTGRTIHVQAKA